MNKSLTIVLGGVWSVVLVVLALCTWERASDLVAFMGWQRPAVGAWAVRCAAASLLAAAQALLVASVVERAYRPDGVSGLMKLSALLASTLGAVSAIALGLAGR